MVTIVFTLFFFNQKNSNYPHLISTPIPKSVNHIYIFLKLKEQITLIFLFYLAYSLLDIVFFSNFVALLR